MMKMEMIGDVKCYHCGHISGQVEGIKDDELVLTAFNPRAGYEGPKIKLGDSLRCERCEGPVYLEDLRQKPIEILPTVLPVGEKQRRRGRGKAA